MLTVLVALGCRSASAQLYEFVGNCDSGASDACTNAPADYGPIGQVTGWIEFNPFKYSFTVGNRTVDWQNTGVFPGSDPCAGDDSPFSIIPPCPDTTPSLRLDPTNPQPRGGSDVYSINANTVQVQFSPFSGMPILFAPGNWNKVEINLPPTFIMSSQNLPGSAMDAVKTVPDYLSEISMGSIEEDETQSLGQIIFEHRVKVCSQDIATREFPLSRCDTQYGEWITKPNFSPLFSRVRGGKMDFEITLDGNGLTATLNYHCHGNGFAQTRVKLVDNLGAESPWHESGEITCVPPVVCFPDAAVMENREFALFPIKLTKTTNLPVTVRLHNFFGGTAGENTDYIQRPSGTPIIITPKDLELFTTDVPVSFFSVEILNNNIADGNKHFFVSFLNADNALFDGLDPTLEQENIFNYFDTAEIGTKCPYILNRGTQQRPDKPPRTPTPNTGLPWADYTIIDDEAVAAVLGAISSTLLSDDEEEEEQQ